MVKVENITSILFPSVQYIICLLGTVTFFLCIF